MKISVLIVVILIGYILSVGFVVNRNMPAKQVDIHKERFHAFMKTYAVEYTDSGCEFGWEMTRQPYTANYTLETAMQLMDSIPQSMYNKYFSTNNE